MLFHHTFALIIGFVLDLIFGDPYWLPHPVRWIGKLIDTLEAALRKLFPKNERGERTAGIILVVGVTGISTASCILILWACSLVSPWLSLIVESIVCYQMLATKALRVESMRVFEKLKNGTLEEARKAVSMIVGRDTSCLDEEEIAKAAVETVAENASDGVIAPLIFMAIAGAAGGIFYKSINTMDSMVGYKNDQYRFLGTAAAILDDILNFIPARISGVLMCLVAPLVKLDGRKAWHIYKRDRKNHASPNSAHTEAACAGALGVQLGGSHSYFGKIVEKPTIGDASRNVDKNDIEQANNLMYATAIAGLAVGVFISIIIGMLTEGAL